MKKLVENSSEKGRKPGKWGRMGGKTGEDDDVRVLLVGHRHGRVEERVGDLLGFLVVGVEVRQLDEAQWGAEGGAGSRWEGKVRALSGKGGRQK